MLLTKHSWQHMYFYIAPTRSFLLSFFFLLRLSVFTSIAAIDCVSHRRPSLRAVTVTGVAAHFIDKSGKQQTTILALRNLQDMHSGKNMAGVLLQIFNEYGIQNRIGYFMADNHEANDTCIDSLLQQLHPWMTAKQRKKRRLRCAGHIIDLCAHAFIMGKDAEKIAREMDAAMREGDLKKIGELWRKRGALGRLHNVIKYIRGSPQRREFFGKQVCGGGLAEFDGLEVSSRSCPSTSYYLDWSIKR